MLTLAAWFHTLSPFALKLSDDFGIRWYGLAYLAGFVIGFFLLRFLAKRGAILIPRDRIADAMMYVVAGVIIGGRLGYCIVYDPHLFTDFSSRFPFWGVLAINRGGMASHGGILGVVIASWFIARGFKDERGKIVGRCSPIHVMEAMAMATPPGLMLGRIANFINGELLGRIHTPPGRAHVDAPWWTVQYPQELLPDNHTPELSAAQQTTLDRLVHDVSPGVPYEAGLRYLVDHAPAYKAQLAPLLSARIPSQLVQALAEGPILFLVLWAVWAKPRRTGVITAAFLIAYGILRIITEIWRLPDTQFADGRPLGLSRGQWLSALMVAIGAAVLIWTTLRKNAEVRGGWYQSPGHTPGA